MRLRAIQTLVLLTACALRVRSLANNFASTPTISAQQLINSLQFRLCSPSGHLLLSRRLDNTYIIYHRSLVFLNIRHLYTDPHTSPFRSALTSASVTQHQLDHHFFFFFFFNTLERLEASFTVCHPSPFNSCCLRTIF